MVTRVSLSLSTRETNIELNGRRILDTLRALKPLLDPQTSETRLRSTRNICVLGG